MDRISFPRIAAIGWLTAYLGFALAAPPDDALSAKLPGESLTTARRLTEAAQRADKQKWAEAVEDYQRILEEAGDDLVPLDPHKRGQCIQARRLCAMQIARHPQLLRLYRSRVDDQAKKWLDQGISERDPLLLRRLVDRAFCSRHTDRALELLGDLAFERGEFAEAEQWWRLLARPASEAKAASGHELLFPDPQGEIALIRAKMILSQIFRDGGESALFELKAFAGAHGKSEGYLAGRKGKLLEILQQAARNAGKLAVTVPSSWPTVGGADSRTAIAFRAPRCRWLDQPWRVSLDVERPVAPAKSRTATQQAQACVFQPVISGDLVLLADGHSVTAYDLFTGQRRGYWEPADGRPNRWDLKTAQECGARFTLTAANNRVYVRIGSSPRRPAKVMPQVPLPLKVAQATTAESYLVCLALPPDREGKFTLCWQIKAPSTETETAAFEGSPLVHDHRVYIGCTRRTNDARAITAIECYRADSGALRWRQDVSDVPAARDGPFRCRYHLLTRAGPNIAYCSHSGAVVAVDGVTGKRVWAVRYPHRGNRLSDGTLSPRDLSPPVHSDGRLFVAPADLNRILCLDAASGQTIWESNSLEVSQLLGVARGRLIFTTASTPAGIRAVAAATGRDLRAWIQPSGDSNGLPTVGRGLLAGDWVFWPTVNGLRILTQEDGEPAVDAFLPLNNSILGNLAVAEGCLVAATERELVGYVPPAALLVPRRKDVQADPSNALKRFRLGLAQLNAGSVEAALDEFQKAEQVAGSPELRSQARQERDAALLILAEREAKAGRPERAYRTAAVTAFPVRLRLGALASLAELQAKRGNGEQAIAAWQAILNDAALRRGHFLDGDGVPRSAALFAFQQINSLIARHGPEVYKKFEAQAKATPFRLSDPKAAENLNRLVAEFPNYSELPRYLHQMADELEKRGNHAEAARYHRRLLRWPAAVPERVQGLAALARHYERQGHREAARASWNCLAREHGDQKIESLDTARTAGALAAAEIKRLQNVPVASALPDLALPLTRTWEFPVQSERLLPMGSPHGNRLFFIRSDGTLVCREAETGMESWKARRISIADSPFPVPRSPLSTWVAHQADLVLVAGPHGIAAFDGPQGTPSWSFDPDPEAGPLGSFQLIGSRLFCFQGQRRLWVLDAETGTVLWALWAPGARVGVSPPRGRFHSFTSVGLDQIIVQPSHGQAGLFDAQTGRKLRAFDVRGEPWHQPPIVLDDRRVCLQPNSRHLVQYDVAAGRMIWRYTVEREAGLTGEPLQVASAGDGLLAIVSRNHGYELIRLSAATGKGIWAKAIFLGVDRPELSRAAWDRDAVCLPVAGVLHAISLADGSRLWSRPLGDDSAGWCVCRTRGFLLAFPTKAEPEMPLGPALRRYLPTSPNAFYPTAFSSMAGLPGILTVLCREQSPSRLVLIAYHPRDGRVLQRLDCHSRGTAIGLSLGERRIVLGLAESIAAWR